MGGTQRDGRERERAPCQKPVYLCSLSSLFFLSTGPGIPATLFLIIIMAFKSAIRDFLQSPHSTANCLQHARSSGPGAIVCKSHATHRALITCNMVTWYEGTAQLLSLTKLKSHLFELYFIG